jgi:hypothetical protein
MTTLTTLTTVADEERARARELAETCKVLGLTAMLGELLAAAAGAPAGVPWRADLLAQLGLCRPGPRGRGRALTPRGRLLAEVAARAWAERNGGPGRPGRGTPPVRVAPEAGRIRVSGPIPPSRWFNGPASTTG